MQRSIPIRVCHWWINLLLSLKNWNSFHSKKLWMKGRILMTAHQSPTDWKKIRSCQKKRVRKSMFSDTFNDILTGLVRKKYGYKGVIVSDAMGMDAITKNFGEWKPWRWPSKPELIWSWCQPPTQNRFDQDWYHCQCSGRCGQTGDISRRTLKWFGSPDSDPQKKRGGSWILIQVLGQLKKQKKTLDLPSTVTWNAALQQQRWRCKNEGTIPCHLKVANRGPCLLLGAFEMKSLDSIWVCVA